MSWVSVLEMAHALNSTQIFHQLISVVSEEKDEEHLSIQDSREVILINSAFHTIFISEMVSALQRNSVLQISQRKQPTFCDTTTGMPAKRRLRIETSAEIPYWWRDTTQIWEVLLIGWSKFSANQNYFPDLGSVTSSVWNFCARFDSQTSFQGDTRGGVAKCRLFCQAIGKSNAFFLMHPL